MSTSLWPALLAAVLGGSSGSSESSSSWSRALRPIQAALYLSVLGEHALYWWIGIVCFVALAYATNPSEASFKTHLTDLSFHLHLRRLRAHEHPDGLHSSSNTLPGDFRRSSLGSEAAASASSKESTASASSTLAPASGAKINSSNSNSGTNTPSGKSSSSKNGTITPNDTQSSSRQHQRISASKSVRGDIHANGDSGRPHVLSFSNRVSISLKTPAYVRTSYALWSTVRILPASSSSNSISKNGSASSSSSKSNNGTPGRPLLNGLPPVTRRASTTLPSLNDRSTRKSSSPSTSSSSSSSRKGAGKLVSTVAHGISNGLANPVCSPWLEQGGYFIGFLGYWWTIDDGTSFSGAREKKRLGNALLAVEEQDEEDDVSIDQHGHDGARNADDLEGGHAFFDNAHAQSQPTRTDDQSASNIHGSSGNVPSNKRKQQQPSKASQSASFRGGQRRSSPTPRQASSKKRGSGSGASSSNTTVQHAASASQGNSSGDVTPVTPSSAVPLDRTRLESGNGDDSQLPGLPFHVDRSKDMANQQQQYAKEGETTTTPSVDGAQVEQVKAFAKEGEEGISTVSHTASAPDSTVATVSPALALLQSQLDDLRTTSAATQARLEAEVEELQARKRDEDAVRTELKARTKVLEENKREAESERLDAEKKLIAARSIKKSVEDRVTKARSELSKLEKKEKEVQEKIVRSREERRAKLDSLREDVKQREAILMKEEEATEKLNKRVADLEREIEERKNDLFHFRREEANAAAQAVTNRMNRAGRGLGSGTGGANATGTGAHSHAHGPHSGAATTAKRHMHPANHAAAAAHSHAQAHRHPSQHPNAAVPIAYPYINAEDQQGKQASGHARAASPSPVGDGGNAQSHAPSAGNAPPGDGQTFGSSFMEHRLQSRRAASAASGLGQSAVISVNQPVSSSMNTSVIGNSASAANALYNRQQLDRTDENADDEEGVDEERKAVFGSTFAPFGPASPASPSTIGAPSPREQHAFIKMNGSSPSLAPHMPYFASDKAIQQEQQNNATRLRMSTSREDFLAAIRAESGGDGNGVDLHATPVIGLAHELAVDDSEAYATTQPRAIIGASGRKDGRSGSGGLRRESFDSVGSFTSSNGGPLSPMTPHQASLIPSQLFDMLDDVEMPASPTPFNAQMQEPHHAFTQGISDAFEHADELLDVQDRQQNQQAVPKRTSGMYSPWADFDMDAGFDFDKPLGYGNSASAEVSRKPSGREVDLLRRRRSGSSLNGSSAHHGDDGKQGEGIFASYGPTHGHHASVGSTGQRSNTSSSGGSISPSLAAAAQGQQQQNPNAACNNLPPGFGKLSPNDLLFDKARHVLSLNPDAKAFSFNRPLPSSGSAGSLNSIGGGAGGNSRTGLPSNATAGAIGDARLAFDSAAGVTAGGGFRLPGGDSPVLSNGTAIGQPGTSTWASPNLASRGLHHNLGYGSSTNLANGGLRESTRSASGPPLTTSNTGGHTFSPFDDDDLLKGW